MNVKIVYHSDSGNTRKIAQAISKAVGVPAEEIKGISGVAEADLLFVGGSLRAFNLEKNCKTFLKSLPDSGISNIALFSTSMSGKGISRFAAKLLKSKNIRLLDEEFKCLGGTYKKTGETHPNDQDSVLAQQFAKKAVGIVAGK